MAKYLLFVCENFADFFRDAASGEFPELEIIEYTAECGNIKSGRCEPDSAAERLKNCPAESYGIICGNNCPFLDKVPDSDSQAWIMKGNTCFSNVLGESFTRCLLSRGAYLTTEPWLEKWESNMEAMGFDRSTAQRCFGEFASEIICVANLDSAKASVGLKGFSDFLGLPFSVVEGDRRLISLTLRLLDSRWSLRESDRKSREEIDSCRKQFADYLTLFEMIRDFSECENENEVVSRVVGKFELLFACESVRFISMKRESFEEGLSPREKAFLRDRFSRYVATEDRRGFWAKIDHSGKTAGMIEARGLRFPEYLEKYIAFAMNASAVIGLALANARKMEIIDQNRRDLEFASSHDALTGLYNRGYFENYIEEIARQSSPACVMMCDIDGLKQIDDTMGHAAGDEAIRGAAEVLGSIFREEDLLARIGGDEFAAVITNCKDLTPDDFRARIGQALDAFNKRNPGVGLKFSCGFSEVSSRSPKDLMKEADVVLYEMKRAKKKP